MAWTLNKEDVKDATKGLQDAKKGLRDATKGMKQATKGMKHATKDATKDASKDVKDATKQSSREIREFAARGAAVATPIVMKLAKNKKAQAGVLIFFRRHPVVMTAGLFLGLAGLRKAFREVASDE